MCRLDYQPLFGKMSPHSSPIKTGPERRWKSSLQYMKIREFKQELRSSTGGGLFVLLSADVEKILGQIVSIRVSNW